MIETRAACLTPPGVAAIATIAVRGPKALDVIAKLFRPASGNSFSAERCRLIGQFHLGHFGEDLADEVVIAVRRLLPPPWVEIHCHGGSAVVRLILETLARQGVPSCSWQELDMQTAANQLAAEVAGELVKASTVRTAAILLDQYHGAFERALREVREAFDRGDFDKATALLKQLAGHAPLGRHLTSPWRVAVAGPPNVGKSSLVNALAGFQRSIVSPTPGTTRDLVTTLIAVDGWPIELIDTAGMREQGGPIEEQGIARARSAIADADICLWLLDASTPPVWPDVSSAKVHLIINKIDLPAVWDVNQTQAALHVSARTGAGMAELCDALARWLVPEPPVAGTPAPFSPAWCDRVEACHRLCSLGQHEEARRLLATRPHAS